MTVFFKKGHKELVVSCTVLWFLRTCPFTLFPQSDKQSSTHSEPVGGHQRLDGTFNRQNQNKTVSNFGPENGGIQSLW